MFQQAIQNMEDWLLHSSIQIDHGLERGGVVGWLTADWQPEFVYYEITGYYLSQLAFTIHKDLAKKSFVGEKMCRSLDWLVDTQRDGSRLQTRLYLREQAPDWRNAAEFAFDLGMVIRGVSHALPLIDAGRYESLLPALTRRIKKFYMESSQLSPYLITSPMQDLPQKWSTLPGPYQLKIAACLSFAEDQDVEPLWQSLCGHWLDVGEDILFAQEFHPLLYYLEGLLLLESRGVITGYLEKVERIYRHIMSFQDENGLLPGGPREKLSDVRSDVIAQALRAGSLLRALGHLHDLKSAEQMELLAKSLLRFLHPDGPVAFFLPGERGVYWNTWCTIFAYQALTYYEAVITTGTIAQELIETLA